MPPIIEAHVLQHWPLSPPLAIAPLERGANNRNFGVTSGAGAFVLKWYWNEGAEAWRRFEHELLDALAHARLPFAVPAPVRSRSGATLVTVVSGGELVRMALFRLIPGHAATFGDPLETRRCGAALASLHFALASVALDSDILVPEAFSELSTIHPRVPDPIDALARLVGSYGDATEAARVMARAEEQWLQHTSGWDRQIIHGDFFPSNTLVDAGEVSGVLDFEYSGLGFRSMDFATGLATFSTRNWEAGCSWTLIDVFASGYLHHTSLQERELTAVPSHLRMREACSLVHWIGRMEQGLTSREEINDRVDRLLALDRWLTANERTLVQRIIDLNAV